MPAIYFSGTGPLTGRCPLLGHSSSDSFHSGHLPGWPDCAGCRSTPCGRTAGRLHCLRWALAWQDLHPARQCMVIRVGQLHHGPAISLSVDPAASSYVGHAGSPPPRRHQEVVPALAWRAPLAHPRTPCRCPCLAKRHWLLVSAPERHPLQQLMSSVPPSRVVTEWLGG